jgi:hypothetical protein
VVTLVGLAVATAGLLPYRSPGTTATPAMVLLVPVAIGVAVGGFPAVPVGVVGGFLISVTPSSRPTTLRHTHATLLLRAGVPVKVVSERLGHANPAFTLTVYQHVIPGMQEEAATLFSELIFGRIEPSASPAP